MINSLDMNITSSCTEFPIFPPVGVQSEIIISVNTDICHFLSVCCKIMCQENCTNFHSLPHVSVTNWVFMAGRAESRFPCLWSNSLASTTGLVPEGELTAGVARTLGWLPCAVLSFTGYVSLGKSLPDLIYLQNRQQEVAVAEGDGEAQMKSHIFSSP